MYTELTHTPLEGMRKSLETFVEFFRMVKDGFSVQKIGKRLGISPTTAFNWRKKVMIFFSQAQEKKVLGGLAEVDETYCLHSKKGDRNLSREPRKRGEAAEKEGLSKEQDCILTLRDRNGNTYMRLAGRGKPGFDDIDEPLSAHAEADSVLCTDGMNAYTKFARVYGVKRKRVKQEQNQAFHLQNINNLHSRLKKWFKNFKGLSSKHLDKYLGFFSAVKA